MTSNNLPALAFARTRFATGEALSQTTRIDLLRRLIADDGPLRGRVAAIVLLLYAQPVTRILALTVDDIRIDDDGAMILRLGDPAAPVPEPFAALIHQLVTQRPQAASRWLFPGRHPGQPLDYRHLSQELRSLGVPLRLARVAAIRQLALQAPAPVIADALGFHHTTTHCQNIHASGVWTRYAAPERADAPHTHPRTRNS